MSLQKIIQISYILLFLHVTIFTVCILLCVTNIWLSKVICQITSLNHMFLHVRLNPPSQADTIISA